MHGNDTGYQYDPLVGWFLLCFDRDIFIEDQKLQYAKPQYSLVCCGSASRYPLYYQHNKGECVGGFYDGIVSDAKIIKFYKIFIREAQISGYIDTANQNWGATKNPFPSSLSKKLPRLNWAYAYEKGSRVFRDERATLNLKSAGHV
ncbi:hypothetical protein UA32_12485 [Photobacterium angustum]|uniref:Uncharacterized protein n=1 Tax=Photobacterium angustum TaxID=661 RepID=A0ABX5H1A2_PHOAN|nr:hypothetical protein [Photobacterium angustum]KJG37764.1 hypothetical protein UA32_12485 [Photobacterium angustum]PSX07031.1 hypothetical protein C0W27_15800 [Photobacterium angustum]